MGTRGVLIGQALASALIETPLQAFSFAPETGEVSQESRIKPHVIAALRKHADRLGGVVEQDGDNPGAQVLRF